MKVFGNTLKYLAGVVLCGFLVLGATFLYENYKESLPSECEYLYNIYTIDSTDSSKATILTSSMNFVFGMYPTEEGAKQSASTYAGQLYKDGFKRLRIVIINRKEFDNATKSHAYFYILSNDHGIWFNSIYRRRVYPTKQEATDAGWAHAIIQGILTRTTSDLVIGDLYKP